MTEFQQVQVRIGARNLTRRYGSVIASDAVELAVAPGTIHYIVGGNGAGKSTLMRILQGVDWPDQGTVILDDQPVRLTSPAEAFPRGVGMVHQEFMLAAPLTLLENLILGREPIGRNGLIDCARRRGRRLALRGWRGLRSIGVSRRRRSDPRATNSRNPATPVPRRGCPDPGWPTAVLAPSQIENSSSLCVS